MDIEDIVHSLNQYVIKEREPLSIQVNDYFIFQRKIEESPTFKCFETCTDIIWYVKECKSREAVKASFTYNTAEEDKYSAIEAVDKMLMESLLSFIRSESFNDVVHGKYST